MTLGTSIMRKDKLIELLSAIPGNPEIALWNGSVGDYHHIGWLDTLTLYKESEHVKRLFLDADRNYDQMPEEAKKAKVKEMVKNEKWKILEGADDTFIRIKKNMVLICPRPRGVTTRDRLGKISY